jgi:hypothetical protein
MTPISAKQVAWHVYGTTSASTARRRFPRQGDGMLSASTAQPRHGGDVYQWQLMMAGSDLGLTGSGFFYINKTIFVVDRPKRPPSLSVSLVSVHRLANSKIMIF